MSHGKRITLATLVFAVVTLLATAAQGQTTWFVDDDAPGDPGPGDPTVSDPLEDGSAAHPFDAIQEGITAASDDDEVVVADGTYKGDGNRDLVFDGKLITVRSANGPANCTIDSEGDANNSHRGFKFAMSGETAAAVVDGFTITGGYLSNDFGGGIYINESSPTINNCIFRLNTAEYKGGAVSVHFDDPIISNCTFEYNVAFEDGGGIHLLSSDSPITNCTFSRNTTAGSGGGLYLQGTSSPTVTNCIFWDDSPDEIFPSATASVTYSDVQGGYTGTGNIDADPLFVDPDDDNLRLARCSPAVDAGDNSAVPAGITSDLDGNPRFADDTGIPDTGNGTSPIVDMGAFERQDQSTNTVLFVQADHATIQGAINAACHGDEIVVEPDTYPEVIDFLGKAITLRSSDGAAVTIIDGDGLFDSVVKCISGEGSDTVLDGFTIIRGEAVPDGGGMFNFNSSPTVRNCTFSDNHASSGGGMANVNSSPTVTSCTFSENSANTDAGGMLNAGGNPVLIDCVFNENTAFVGGGMSNYGGNVTASNCTFSGNTADFYGGGMLNGFGSSTTVTDCTFTGNTVTCRNGGGMYNFDFADVVVSSCTFSGNRADLGGGMANDSSATVTVTKCTFSENSAVVGGGIGNKNSSPTVTDCTFSGNPADKSGGGMANDFGSSPTVTNCVFSGNTAVVSFGGGMYNGHDSSPTVTNCTFSANTADVTGGGIHNEFGSSPTVTNCILWGDSPDEIFNVDDAVDNPTVGFSDVQGGLSAGTTDGGGNLDADPLFVDANGPDDVFGTEDDDLRLLPGSPCIDAADNMGVPAGIVTDLDGAPRVLDDPNTVDTGAGTPPIVDMGAYEFRDCDGNGLPDGSDIANGTFGDGDGDWLIDPCDDTEEHTIADGETLLITPMGDSDDPTEQTAVSFTNNSGQDADVTVTLSETVRNPPDGMFALFGESLDIETNLADGTFQMTLTIPFTEDDLLIAGLTAADLDQVDLRYYNETTMLWNLAVDGNCGNPPACDAGAVGSRFQIEDPTTLPPPSSTLGDYGIFFNTTTRAGYVFAIVDHTTEFSTAAPLLVSSPLPAGPPHDILKIRYLSVDPRGAGGVNAGQNFDIKLTLTSTLVNGVTAVGSVWWANAPDADCVAVVGPTQPAVPPNWDACPALHLAGCPIIPTSIYDIVAVVGGLESGPPLIGETQARPGVKWHGDAVGFFDGNTNTWTPPNLNVNIDDAVAAIKTFQNPAAINATHVSRTDVHPNRDGAQINKTVNFDDVFVQILGFQGFEYPGPAIHTCLDP